MNKVNKHTLLVTSFGLLFIVILGIYAVVLTSQFNDLKKEKIIADTQSHYAISKLEFCFNKMLVPCDDAAVVNWNSGHTDDTFKLKSFQDLIEEGIEQYANSRK